MVFSLVNTHNKPRINFNALGMHGVGILAYIVLAIVLPAAKTPEEQLQMQGKKVTPQALADAVIDEKQPMRQNRGCLGSVLAVIASLFAALFVGIAALMLVFLIPLYAVAHMLLSKAGKIQPMGIVQRIFWIVFWVFALGSMVPSLVWIQQNKTMVERVETR